MCVALLDVGMQLLHDLDPDFVLRAVALALDQNEFSNEARIPLCYHINATVPTTRPHSRGIPELLHQLGDELLELPVVHARKLVRVLC
jgi:hypothetical protein